MLLSRFLGPVAVVLGAVSLGGCYGYASTEPPPAYATTEVTSAPAVDIEAYPSTVYEGRTVYLYNNRWYYRNGSRWAYYQNEPPVLERHRRYVQSAPPAQRGYEYRPQSAPPANYHRGPYDNGPYNAPRDYSREPNQAPPATRVQ
jgi:hypothetical protein